MEDVKDTSQNVDSVLDSVSDEYLKKRKRNKKITLSIISAVVFALVVVIIVLACVKVNLKPYFLSRPSNIQVYTNNSLTYVTTDENYDDFYGVYEDSFCSTILTAMFTGNLGDYKIVEGATQAFYSDSTNRQGISSTLQSYLGSNYVHLFYAQQQTLYNADGSVYYSNRNTNQYYFTYQDVYFNITDTNNESELTFYFGACYTTEEGQSALSPKIISITVRANSYAIYDYVTGD